MSDSRKTLPGSSAFHYGSSHTGVPAADEQIHFTVHLRRKKPVQIPKRIFTRGGALKPAGASRSTDHHADPADLALITSYAHQHGLTVTGRSIEERNVRLLGTAASINRALGISLAHYQHETGGYRGYEGDIYLPPDQLPLVESVSGLDTRKLYRFHAREFTGEHPTGAIAPPKTFFPGQVASAYDFPPGTGAGQSVAIVELGGAFDTSVLDGYWKTIGLKTTPSVTVGANSPVAPKSSGADIEVYLDICVIGAICPDAAIVVYFANDFASGIKAAINDPEHHHSAVSISWGGPERYSFQGSPGSLQLTTEATATQNALIDAYKLGIPVFISSGDNGSGNERDSANQDTILTKLASVSWPASSEYAIGCGGTSLTVDRSGQIADEVVWNNLEGLESNPAYTPGHEAQGGATGGGVSLGIPLPSYQSKIKPKTKNPVPASVRVMRGVPDVAGNADSATGYKIAIPGRPEPGVVGGTSAVAPLWTALTALLNENLAGHRVTVSRLHGLLYTAGKSVLRDITDGNNNTSPGVGGYAAGPGWDGSTGLGSPHGAALLAALKKLAQRN